MKGGVERWGREGLRGGVKGCQSALVRPDRGDAERVGERLVRPVRLNIHAIELIGTH